MTKVETFTKLTKEQRNSIICNALDIMASRVEPQCMGFIKMALPSVGVYFKDLSGRTLEELVDDLAVAYQEALNDKISDIHGAKD